MTAEEALKILHEPDRIGVTIIKANTPDATKYNDDSITALQMAISALEKQIPKNPKEVPSKDNDNLWHLYCPSCKNWIGMWNGRLRRGDMYNNSNRNICPYCGQAIVDLEGEGWKNLNRVRFVETK